MSVKIKIRKNKFDEYEVRWIENGLRNEARTYYTDDEDDAIITKHTMRKHVVERTCKTCGAYVDETNYCNSCGNELK